MSESEILRAHSRAKYFLTLVEEELQKKYGKLLADCTIYIEEQQLYFRWLDEGQPWLAVSWQELLLPNHKQILYKAFIQATGVPDFPWGSLQGVRPGKLVHDWMNQGLTEAEGVTKLEESYFVEPERAKLLGEIVTRQRSVLAKVQGTVGIYIGIPFCPSRCLYCSFPGEVLPARSGEMESFWQFMKRDIQDAAQWIKKHKKKLSTIYIGGGTPTTLSLPILTELFELLHHEFDLGVLNEFTLEAGRPDTITPENMKLAREFGVDRISVNPQTMQQRTLKRIGRTHSVQSIEKAVEIVRANHFKALNMDLIAGLPGEQTEDLIDSIEKIIRFSPENITLHALALKRGSRWLEDQENKPSAEVVRSMIESGRTKIISLNYQPYYLYRQKNSPGRMENVGYGLEGFESFYNIQMMEETHTIIGIGPGAATKKVTNHGKMYHYHFPKDRIAYQSTLDACLKRRLEVLEKDE